MLTIDEVRRVVIHEQDGVCRELPMNSPEAFELASAAWLRCGWETKHVYSFTWLGRPVIQLPEDMIRMQELIFRLRPDVIIETGVAHGGSAIFYASLCHLLGAGRVIGIDIEIRPHNRQAIEAHEFSRYVTLVEGDSTAPSTVSRVKSLVGSAERALVVLDSNHTKAHVLAELQAYAPLVQPGSYLVATDGIKELVAGLSRTEPDWSWDHPRAAAAQFCAENPDFVLEEPAPLFNEGTVRAWVSYWSGGFVKRIR